MRSRSSWKALKIAVASAVALALLAPTELATAISDRPATNDDPSDTGTHSADTATASDTTTTTSPDSSSTTDANEPPEPGTETSVPDTSPPPPSSAPPSTEPPPETPPTSEPETPPTSEPETTEPSPPPSTQPDDLEPAPDDDPTETLPDEPHPPDDEGREQDGRRDDRQPATSGELEATTMSGKTWANGCITGPIRPNDSGPQVGCLKRRLRNLNFPVDRHGYYGYRAIDAVRQIKRNAGLPDEGYVGRHALNAIFNPNRKPVRTWANCITRQLRPGDRGYQVACLKQRLKRLKLVANADGHYGPRTVYAVNVVKRRNGLVIDGIASPTMMTRMFNAKLPAPLRAGYDTQGNRLSPVAVAGPHAPMPPAGNGTGRRVVYSRAQQRAWAIDRYGMIIRSWRVSGSKYSNEPRGTHRVYSRSRYGTAYTGSGMVLPFMVRWYYTPKGNHIGFHEIPRNSSGQPIQSISELGQRRSAGCQRQAYLDALFMWNWAPVGTKVVVL